MKESLVADTACLIALERIGRLNLLPELFESVVIPPEVAREFGSSAQGLRIQAPANKALLASLKLLVDDGEAEAIALASELKLRIILDDGQARFVAKQVGVATIGTIGLLLLAKKAGLIPALEPLIGDLERCGFYMTSALKQEALRLAAE